MSDVLLTTAEAAEILGVRSQTLAVWRCTGRHLPYVRVGRSIRYRQSDLEEWLKRRTVAAECESELT